MIAKVWLRPLLFGEAYPPEKNHQPTDPAECKGCKLSDDPKRSPLYLATTVSGLQFVTCRPCFQTGRSA